LTDVVSGAELFWPTAYCKVKIFLVHGKVEQGGAGQLRIVHPDFEVLEPAKKATTRASCLCISARRHADVVYAQARVPSARIPALFAAGLPVASQTHAVGVDPGRAAPITPTVLDTSVSALNDASSSAHRSVIFEELFYMQLGLGSAQIFAHTSRAQPCCN
jgi:hypothetical protein